MTAQKDLDIVVVGSIIMDLICYSSRIPILGETIEGSDFKTGFGGKGANQCVAASRLGAKCAFVGKVGDDDNGQRYYENLRNEGVNVEGIHTEKGKPTGVASIMVGESDGQNIIVIVPGANKEISPAYILEHGEKFIKRAKVVIVQLEIPIESTLTALQLAKKYGAITIFNTAPGSSTIPLELFSLTDILCLNETETQLVTGITKITSPEDAKVGISTLLDKFPCKSVVVTLGAQGSVFWDQNAMNFMEAPKVKAVDSTGAGDCFVGTLAACLAKGQDLFGAMKKATANASDSVLRKGTQSSFPSQFL